MKITLSKAQWQFIGKKAGWMGKQAAMLPSDHIPEHIIKEREEYLKNLPCTWKEDIDNGGDYFSSCGEWFDKEDASQALKFPKEPCPHCNKKIKIVRDEDDPKGEPNYDHGEKYFYGGGMKL